MTLEGFIETARAQGVFDRAADVFIARAPGRLDVMGGIADYSGSLVLQRPIAEATWAAYQPSYQNGTLRFISLGDPLRQPVSFWAREPEKATEYQQARVLFNKIANKIEKQGWGAYVFGVFVVLMKERGVRFGAGGMLLISSSVPEAKGVASSAALEVATMQAVCAAQSIPIQPQELAAFCQIAENRVAGAPCGIMDQMTSACGEEDSLLALLCQPAELQEPVRVPDDVRFWGIDSGERHAVSGSDYSSVRCGAFMGYRMISGNDKLGGGYLANISVDDFERNYQPHLPEEMSGEEFLLNYQGKADSVTTVDPSRVYKIRQPTAHPVYEHQRVREFRDLLLGRCGESQLRRLGELMYQSHASYSACGLGSRGTDLIVDLVRAAGAERGLYGARITGGGSGGTVVVVGRADSDRTVAGIVEQYAETTGYRPHVFSGSSPGAGRFGVQRIRL
jgi:L-arabinokinase